MAPVDSSPAPSRQAGAGAPEAHGAHTAALGGHVRDYLRRLFDSHAGPDKTWSGTQVRTFLRHVQDADDGTPAALRLLSQPSADLDGFLAYMASPDGAITKAWPGCDLSWPLASYFISSSHNTYLSGNQLSSDSTTAAYTNVLLRGCRCVEIDVWDGDDSDSDDSSADEAEAGGSSLAKTPSKRRSRLSRLRDRLPGSLAARLDKTSLGKRTDEPLAAAETERGEAAEEPKLAATEPRVLHGYTLTKEVPFRDVCNAIRESAFVVTDLPLIISLEVHCSAEQQAVMVDIMKQVWGDMLVQAPDTLPDTLPSPHDLRGRILVKAKHVPLDTAATEITDSGEDDRLPAGARKKAPKKASKVIQELSRLAVYAQAFSFKAWTQPEAANPMHIFSLSESKFLDHHDKNAMELFNHNKHYLMRAYPSGLRISSSNLNPPVFWGAGTQIVALNWQQTDEGMMLNEGMFAGTSGYVLKPEAYRPLVASKPAPSTLAPRRTLSLTITFLAAQSIPLPHDTTPDSFEPYVKTEIHADASRLSPLARAAAAAAAPRAPDAELKARTRTHRGCDVDFAAEKVSFAPVAGLVDELTLVRFTIRDDEIGRDDLAAWACVRLDRLGQGYRLIRLMDHKGAPTTHGSVLVKVEKTLT